jgi:hypothetical protein
MNLRPRGESYGHPIWPSGQLAGFLLIGDPECPRQDRASQRI